MKERGLNQYHQVILNDYIVLYMILTVIYLDDLGVSLTSTIVTNVLPVTVTQTSTSKITQIHYYQFTLY